MRNKGIIVFLLIIFFSNCKDIQKNKDNLGDDMFSDTLKINKEEIAEKIMNIEKINSFPNPLDLFMILKRNKIRFSDQMLNNTIKISNYHNEFKKALNLGVYGADLVYLNIYDNTTLTPNYLNNVKSLSADLMLDQFFDIKTMERLSENNDNVDSLLFITATGYDKMKNYLKEQKRIDINFLITYGGWIEAMYIAISRCNENDKEIIDKIAEQRAVLKDIISLLSLYKYTDGFSELYQKMLLLNIEYEKVKITYTYAEPTYKESDDGSLIIKDNSKTKIDISKGQFIKIKNIVKDIRAYVIL